MKTHSADYNIDDEMRTIDFFGASWNFDVTIKSEVIHEGGPHDEVELDFRGNCKIQVGEFIFSAPWIVRYFDFSAKGHFIFSSDIEIISGDIMSDYGDYILSEEEAREFLMHCICKVKNNEFRSHVESTLRYKLITKASERSDHCLTELMESLVAVNDEDDEDDDD